MAFTEITFFQVLGKPLIFWVGITTIIFLMLTFCVGYLQFRGKARIHFKWHYRLATITLLLAFGHALLGILPYL